MKRVDHAPRFGSFAGSASLPLGSAKVGEDKLSRCNEVPDFRISSRSPSRGAVFAAWVWGLYLLAACVVVAVGVLAWFYEIGCAVSHFAGSGRSNEARVLASMDLESGAGDAAPGDDLAGMGKPKNRKTQMVCRKS